MDTSETYIKMCGMALGGSRRASFTPTTVFFHRYLTNTVFSGILTF